MAKNAEVITAQANELDKITAEKQKLIDEMNELKGVKKQKKTVNADNGPR